MEAYKKGGIYIDDIYYIPIQWAYLFRPPQFPHTSPLYLQTLEYPRAVLPSNR